MLKTNPAAALSRPATRPVAASLAEAGYIGVRANPVFAAREQRLLRELSALSAMRAASEVRRGR